MPNKKTYKIQNLKAREILDSRGNPTIETEVVLDCGLHAKAGVSSGTSLGRHEAVELRDCDKRRFRGLGVLSACKNVETKILRKLKGMDILKQKEIDEIMIKLDNTDDKSNLGANAILSVSLACARAGAMVQGLELYNYLKGIMDPARRPVRSSIDGGGSIIRSLGSAGWLIPMFNIFNGGKHADTNLDIQEIMIAPVGIKSFKEQIRAGAEVFHKLGSILKENHFDTDVGLEGGYAPNINSTIQAFDLIMKAIQKAYYKPGQEIGLALDIGASELYETSKRLYSFDLDDHYFISDQLISLYRDWSQKYPIFSIEDGLAQDDWEGWENLTQEFKKFKPNVRCQMLIVGDDLTVTNIQRLKVAIKRKACNAVILKPNQIGTLTESIEFAKTAKDAGMKVITSHRSGETNDDFIADLAVAIESDFVKFGSLSRGERVCKWNRLMEIGK